ncbi:MAG: S41 family peptidase [Allosphingosinicella sp.]
MKAYRLSLLLAPALLSASALGSPAIAQPPPAAATAPTPSMDAASRKAVIEGVISRITASYVFPEKAPAIAKALRRQLSSGGFDSITDPKAFAEAVNKVLETVAHDKHLGLSWSPQPLPPMGPGGEPDAAMIAMYQTMMRRMNYAIPKAEVLEGNIGYLKMNLFARAQDAGPTLAAAMAFLQYCDALIFDIRDNGGGDPGMVAMALSYLVPPETEINRFHQRGKDVDEQVWSLPYVPGGRWSTDKPVYVLTSNRTGSGAEEFAYDVQQMKRGTVVGAVTWGGANPGGFLPIDEHFGIFVPTGAAVNPISKTNWEGVGVKPDVAVDPAVALDTARRLALEKLIATATGDRARQLQHILDAQPVPPANPSPN